MRSVRRIALFLVLVSPAVIEGRIASAAATDSTAIGAADSLATDAPPPRARPRVAAPT